MTDDFREVDVDSVLAAWREGRRAPEASRSPEKQAEEEARPGRTGEKGAETAVFPAPRERAARELPPPAPPLEVDLGDPLRLEPPLPGYGAETLRLADLLKYRDRAFVEAAFRLLLRRDPSPEDLEHHVGRLRRGEVSRVEALGRIRYCEEGRQKAPAVRGLLLPLLFETACRVPVLGAGLSGFASLLSLPAARRRRRAEEALLFARLTALEEGHNALRADLEGHLARLSTTTDHTARRVDLLGRTLDVHQERVQEQMRRMAARREEDLLRQRRSMADAAAELRSLESRMAQDTQQVSARLEASMGRLTQELRDDLSERTEAVAAAAGSALEQAETVLRKEFRGDLAGVQKEVRLALESAVRRLDRELDTLSTAEKETRAARLVLERRAAELAAKLEATSRKTEETLAADRAAHEAALKAAERRVIGAAEREARDTRAALEERADELAARLEATSHAAAGALGAERLAREADRASIEKRLAATTAEVRTRLQRELREAEERLNAALAEERAVRSQELGEAEHRLSKQGEVLLAKVAGTARTLDDERASWSRALAEMEARIGELTGQQGESVQRALRLLAEERASRAEELQRLESVLAAEKETLAHQHQGIAAAADDLAERIAGEQAARTELELSLTQLRERLASAADDLAGRIAGEQAARAALEAALVQRVIEERDGRGEAVNELVRRIDQERTDRAEETTCLAEATDALRAELGRTLLQAGGATEAYEGRLSLLERAAPAQVPDAWYGALQERFRGGEDLIRERLSVYLEPLRVSGAGSPGRPVLDLGCGRGEWLDLLRQSGMEARGVDTSGEAVEQCAARGLEVARGDVLDYLAALPAESLGAISAFHLLEHLDTGRTIALLDAAHRALAPGGLVLVEMPNPANLRVGGCYFYLDPTHRNPVPRELAVFFVERAGFEVCSVLDLNPFPPEEWPPEGQRVPALEPWFFGARDYGIVAAVPGPPPPAPAAGPVKRKKRRGLR